MNSARLTCRQRGEMPGVFEAVVCSLWGEPEFTGRAQPTLFSLLLLRFEFVAAP